VTRLDNCLLSRTVDDQVIVPPRFIVEIIAEIEQLRKERNGWQAEAAGISEDLSNAEDEIELLQEEINALRLQVVTMSIPEENTPRVRRKPPKSVSQHKLENSDTVLYNLHDSSRCAGEYCTIHNMSDHSMRSFPQSWRWDSDIMERICPHGIGHPDPDNPWSNDDHRWIHGCDGCCYDERHS
jgi:hypothetical protein